ncbi:hypothetical protein BH10ACI1_BH10ACI1_25090 [soil metagenome]
MGNTLNYYRDENYFVQVVILISLAFSISCNAQNTDVKLKKKPIETSSPKPQIIADSFAYPIGKTEIITAAKDNKDDWYNAQDFTRNSRKCGRAIFVSSAF